MVVGAGFALDAVRRARQYGRAMTARSSRTYLSREAGEDYAEREWEDFPCLFLCGSCGLLADPASEQPPADPGRASPIHGGECPHCQARAWIDLRSKTSALAVRDMEENLRQEPPDWVKTQIKAASGGLGIVAGGATALMLGALMGTPLGGVIMLSTAAAAVAAYTTNSTMTKPLARLIMTRDAVGPGRWLRPMPLVDERSTVIDVVRGTATSDEAPLTAPFSGRECLAYEIGAVFDADGDAYPPMWVLREVRARGLRVGDRQLAAGQVDLELPFQDLTLSITNEQQPQVRRLLRERGLFLYDGRWDFFEAVVREGDEVEIRRHAKPDDAPWLIHPARA